MRFDVSISKKKWDRKVHARGCTLLYESWIFLCELCNVVWNKQLLSDRGYIDFHAFARWLHQFFSIPAFFEPGSLLNICSFVPPFLCHRSPAHVEARRHTATTARAGQWRHGSSRSWQASRNFVKGFWGSLWISRALWMFLSLFETMCALYARALARNLNLIRAVRWWVPSENCSNMEIM